MGFNNSLLIQKFLEIPTSFLLFFFQNFFAVADINRGVIIAGKPAVTPDWSCSHIYASERGTTGHGPVFLIFPFSEILPEGRTCPIAHSAAATMPLSLRSPFGTLSLRLAPLGAIGHQRPSGNFLGELPPIFFYFSFFFLIVFFINLI